MMLIRPPEDQRDYFWPVFGDIALAMLLLFLLLLVLQVIESSKLEAFAMIKQNKKDVEERLKKRFGDKVTVSYKDRLSHRITFSSDVLFRTCGAEVAHMREGAEPLVSGVGKVLSGVSWYFSEIEVEGHTDERDPSNSDKCPYESNWQLSSARATTVVHLLDQAGIEPEKLSAVGRSEFHPVASVADSLKTQADHVRKVYQKNRRIEMILGYSEHPNQPSGE